MAKTDDSIWAAILRAEEEHEDGAEAHARLEAERANAAGAMFEAAIWDAAAHALHGLHSINRTRARLRGNPLPRQDRGCSNDP